jgi:hypothetical protein
MKILILAIVVFFTANIAAQTSVIELKIKDTKSSFLKKDISEINKITEPTAKKPNDFYFSTNLYLWALSMDGVVALPVSKPELTITQTPQLSVSVKFSDLLSKLKMALMLAGKFVCKNVGLIYDVNYAKLGFDGTVPVSSGYVSGSIVAKQFTGDFALLFKFPMKNKKVTVMSYAGARIFAMDNTIDLLHNDNTILTVNKSKTIVDLIVGADTKIDLSKRWLLYIKADVGGFGISSKFTGLLLWTVGYKFTEQFNTSLGVKYLYTDYDKDNFLWKVSQYGALITFGYMFK